MDVKVNGHVVYRLTLYTWILAFVASFQTCFGATISEIQPTSGGIGGDVLVTIFGSGFSNQFSLTEDPHIGNTVYLVSSNGSVHACTVHKEGSTPDQIMFYTPSGLTNDEDHYVKVVVDGYRIEDHAVCNGNPSSGTCTFHPEASLTPWISSVTPQIGPPGTMVKIQGKMFTDRYTTDVSTGTNGKTQTLLRVYVGPHLCDLYEDAENLYGLSIYGESSDYGVIDCNITGSSVGFFNISYIVDPPYGSFLISNIAVDGFAILQLNEHELVTITESKSMANPNLYHVSYNDNIYLYQIYADITRISHSKGSEAGGLILTIYGNYFDDRPPYTLPRAFVDDTPCEITEVLPDAYIKCIVAAKQDDLSFKFEGNRGVIYEYWTNFSISYLDLDSILLLDSTDSGYHLEKLDKTYMLFYDANGARGQHVGRMTFYFRPPHSGHYEFFLHAFEGAKLFVDGISKITIKFYSQESVTLTLDGKKKYLFEIVLHTNYVYSYINLRAKYFNTTFTNSMTSKADQEQQRINIRSTVVNDVQELEFDNSFQQIHVDEVQMVAIESAGYFRFGMFGVYTEPLATFMTDQAIQNAIKALPIWGADETIDVKSIQTTKTTYNITFHSKRGNFPNIDVIPVVGSELVSYTVTEHTPGIPDLDTVVLMMDGVVSEPFSVASLKAGHISLEKIIEEMFTSKCPQELDGHGSPYYNSFEYYSHYSREFRDYRVRNTEAFCGRYVLKNPNIIFNNDQGSPLIRYGTLCFAYKGFYKNKVRIRYSYNDDSDSKHYSYYEFYHFFKTDSANESHTWYYTCVNVNSIVTRAKPGYTEYRLHGVWVYRLRGVVDVYIDSVYVGRETTTDDQEAYLRRKLPAHYKKAFIDEISVSTLPTGKFEVSIKPLDCGIGFPLFQLANGDNREPSFGTTGYDSTSAGKLVASLTSTTGVSAEGFTTTAVPLSTQTSPTASTVNDSTASTPSSTVASTNATFYRTTQSLLNYTYTDIVTSDVTAAGTSTGSTSFVQRWPVILLVTRISEASPPVSGLIDISFNGKERKGVNILLTTTELDKELESIENIGFTEITKTGDCANFALTTKFLSLPGDLPQMKVNFSQLEEIEAYASITTVINGGLNYNPLMGDMVSTVHSVPQVRVSINDVPTACSGDCSYQWDTSVTPVIIEVNPQSGMSSLSTSIVISGRGFSANISENNVTIGGVECTVTAATNTSITCNVGNGPSGPYPVFVTVDNRGRAAGYVEFTYTSGIISISPTSGSLGGGIKLTIAGYGFNQNANVTIDNMNCDVISVRSDKITCMVPAHSGYGTYDVQVKQVFSQMIHYGFTYDILKTATVSSVTPQVLNVTGGNVTVFGSSFTNNAGYIFIGSRQAIVTFCSDTRIDLYVGEIESGLHQLKIDVTNGFAVNVTDLQLPCVIADLRITHVHPLQGSLLGGTELTITGSGFGTEVSHVKVKAGKVNCNVTKLTNSELCCTLEYAGTTHYVTNKGVDPAFGVYYAFDKPFITIKEGDFVQWAWETPTFVNHITHAIIEVGGPNLVTQKTGGFMSGIPSRNGVFSHQFVRAGTFYVWSGFVDIWDIKNYAGTIEVVQAISTSGIISVRIGNAEAEHVIGDVLDLVDDPVYTGKPGCDETKSSVNDVSIFSFEFWSCSTPIVNTINVNTGTIQTKITINGEGFSYTEGQNEVKFGSQLCNVTSASENSLICNIEKTGTPEVAVLNQLELRVNNRGSALINITDPRERGFALLPNIETISPVHGSIAGGTILTITGFGFGKAPLVTIGGYNCIIISSSYSEIICDTPASLTEDEEEVYVNVFVYVHGIPLQSECETKSGECAFVYTSGLTSTVTTVSPSITSGTTTFNITGTSLGNNTAELDVDIGGVAAYVIEAADTYIMVSVDNLPGGGNDVVVRVKDYGKASGFLQVHGTLSINNVYPSSGSIHGETTITVLGNGFVENDTTVTVGGASCFILSTSLSQVSCITQAHSAGSVSITVLSNGLSNTSFSYSFATASSPTITSVIPTSGFPGDTLTLFGSNLKGSGVTVHLGSSRCDVTLANTDKIECIVGNHSTGSVDVFVHVAGLGASNSDVQFEFQLSLLSITPIHGSVTGGQLVYLTGTGIDSSAVATVCGKICLLQKATSTSYLCRTPANPAQSCDVGISLNGLERTLPTAYRYMTSLTPSILNVSPRRGGTGGGTILTISGEGFGSQLEIASVEIDGVSCQIANITNTEIRCITGPHVGSVHTKVEVQVSENGIANEVSSGDADFQYVDVWSSPFTWGGGPLPEAGDFVVIPSGTTILLDIDTPILSFLLMQGGSLIFDEKDLELQANIIMITDGGLLQVGRKDKPFQHKGIITLHGHFRSKELPIYGAKVLAVRNGTLDLYGVPVPLTWTYLSTTAVKGSNTLHLQAPVEWKSGDEIVIASTGHRLSQHENEKKIISAVSDNGTILTLTSSLEAEHISVQEMFQGHLIEMRAEVGLLTRNVVVRGSDDPQWHDEVKPCTAGFNFGLFGTNQECSLGRFDDEIGSSQFGVVIFVHPPLRDTQATKIHISYTEVTFAGQTFRLGRHPLQFYLNGNLSESFVRGCSFHKTFNRAVNIQNSQNIQIEQNVIFDILGSGFVLEGGNETGITLEYNLAIRVTGCTTLLNADLTPASYSLANPDNTVKHNAAAGGTHYGYWFKLDYHQTGSSYNQKTCTKNVPLKIFQNNSAHSFGWIGLYVYNDYFPSRHGCGGSEVEVAIFDDLHSWNNNKGVAAGNIGAVQFINFTLVQNRLAGIEVYSILNVPRYTADSPSIQNSVIVGQTTVKPTKEHGCTRGGIVLPLGRGFTVRNVSFVNFNKSNGAAFRWTRSLRRCPVYCGGFTYHLESMAYINTPNKAFFDWDWEGIILDRDGTSTSKSSNWTVLPTTGTLPHDCEPAPEFSIGVPASTCPQKYKWHRYAFNNYYYRSRFYITGRNFIIANQYGNSSVPYATKRFTHNRGWMCVLLSKTSYKFHFEDVHPFNNISFGGTFYDFQDGDFLFISLNVPDLPDWFSVEGERINASSGIINQAKDNFGAWKWNNFNREIKFLVNTFTRWQHPVEMGIIDIPFNLRIYKCFYTDCIPPPDPNETPPAKERPLNFKYWHDPSIWVRMNDGYIANGGKTGKRLPRNFENVKILPYTWVMVNLTAINKLGSLLLFGVLEFADSPEAVYVIEADYIIIKGGRLIIGWPDDPFDGLATITLRESYSLPTFNLGEGPPLGRKAIGVFGGIDLIGKNKGVTWTYLNGTANVGSRQIVLLEQVRWLIGDEIVISPTGFGPGQSETFKIISIGTDQVTVVLNATLKFQHIVYTETLSNGQKVILRAAVGLLSHSIKIIGDDPLKAEKKASGARVLVGLIVDNERTYSGYARLSNVEFKNTGQMGFSEMYDPRFSLVFLDVGKISDVKPSSVTNCSFHNGFNTAVGVIGTEHLNTTDNVIYGNRGHGLKITSVDTRLVHNLVIGVEDAGIEAMQSLNLTLQDNLVTDSKTIAIRIPSLACGETIDRYENNKVFSNVRGAVVSPTVYTNAACAKIRSFIAWKNIDFGLLYEGEINAVFDQNLLIENRMGLGAAIVNPRSTKQIYLNITVVVRNTTFIGQTSSFNCGDMIWLGSNRFLPSTILGSSWHFSDGMVGLVFPTYNVVGGLTKVENVTFAKYDDSFCRKNYAITTNLARNDLQRPVYSERVTLFDVEHANKILFQRPVIGMTYKCFAMNCDVFRVAFFKDLDGTFLGHRGNVIPRQESEAINNSIIPREMVTRLDGTRIPYQEIAPNKGVVRNDNCTYQWRWQAFECMDDLNYKVLTIENMDRDAKSRQISPVALLGDGYIDLIDVPLAHGYCTQYTCRNKRSLFITLIATDISYLLHFTRTTPRHMRYRILNADPTEGIKLTVWYSRPNRLDVFVDGVFKSATNARTEKDERYIIAMPNGKDFQPRITNETGTNYFDRNRGEITFIIKGPVKIDVVSQNTILVSFGLPALSISEVFGENIIENLAAFLDIPLTKVRIVNIVSASTNGRRKRSESALNIEIEIGNEPEQGIDSNVTLPDYFDYSDLEELVSLIVNECQLGDFSVILGESIVCGTIEFPSNDSEMASIVYNNQNPDYLYFYDEPESEYEGVLLKTQPKIRVVDIHGYYVTELGTSEYPWQVRVSKSNETGHPLAVLYGSHTINCSQGWFNFTDLAVSHSGADYILEFNVIYPNRAEHFSLTSKPFNVTARPLKIRVYNQSSMHIFAAEQFSVTLNILDKYTDEEITNVTWREHMWSSDVSMLYPSVYANLTGSFNASFDEDTGRVTFHNLSVSGVGLYYLKFRLLSDPPEYNLSLNWRVAIKNPEHINMAVEESATIKIKFDEAFQDVLPTVDERSAFEQTLLTDYAHLWPDVQFINGSVYEGSIVVEFVIAGSTRDVNSTIYEVCDDIYNGTQYSFKNITLSMSPFMQLNNSVFYGVKCGDIPGNEKIEDTDTPRTYLTVIIVVPIIGCIILIFVIAVIFWRCKLIPNTKVHVSSGGQQENDQQLYVEEDLFCVKSNGPKPRTEAAVDPEKIKRPGSVFSLKI